MTDLLKINNISCQYDDSLIIKDFSLIVKNGELTCLLGPSGCGKTTVLRAIAGFEPLQAGEILLRNKSVSRPGYLLPPEKRKIGMVFQDSALFPHMDVEHNIGFSLRKLTTDQERQTTGKLLELVGLTDLGKRYPHELSGGQQQRVALARALANEPDLILMDEPFANLDVELRERLATDVRAILKEQGITALLVTHDQAEAFAVGDRIGVMYDGQIKQYDTPFNLYHEPADKFIADFIGQGVFLNGQVVSPSSVKTDIGIIHGDRAYPWPAGTEVITLIRPDDIVPDENNSLVGEIVSKAFKGAETLYMLKLENGTRLLSMFPSHDDHYIGDKVGIRIDAQHLVAFAK